ncbi:MAG TPA: DUF4407 domain-containing protein [Bacteroidales bacterium]|nr:DUF4407 domain-containing protein [Bacteroidales bacterium]
MKNFWLRTGCYMTGHNYEIIRNSSEASSKTVKKFLSAILIVSILWAFIGYSFAKRYLHSDVLVSSLVALILVIIVIQIERQIIMSVGKNKLVILFRILIGTVMAVIGSVIIDQIIFKDDIEKNKISNLQQEVNEILPVKTNELDYQIRQIDSTILEKEEERAALLEELAKKPFIKSASTETRHLATNYTDQRGVVKDTIGRRTDYTLTDVPNPKANLLPGISNQIDQLRKQKAEKENSKINIRQEIEADLKSKTGFLDELQVLFSILLTSPIAMFVWIMFFLFFMSLEILVLVNKFGEGHNDYDKVITHQMETRISMLDNIGK